MSNATQDPSDGTLVITINRPSAYNFLGENLHLELKAAFERIQEPDVRAVILLGRPKTFCTDQNLKEHISDLQSGTGMGEVVEECNSMVTELTVANVPVITAIEGVAADADWLLALHCDFRIADPKVSFKAAPPLIGLATDCGMSTLLPRMVSDARTRELLFSDKKVFTDETLSFDLVIEVVDDSVARIRELIVQFAAGPTAALKEVKVLLRRDTLAVATAGADAQARLAVSTDHKGAVAAFLEKRSPCFVGEQVRYLE